MKCILSRIWSKFIPRFQTVTEFLSGISVLPHYETIENSVRSA